MSSDIDTYKIALYDQFARIGKAVGNGRRLLLLESLAQGEHSVENLALSTGLSIANTSQHLQQLREAGLVQSRKQGQHVFYTLTGSYVIDLVETIGQIAHRHLDEMGRIVKNFLHVRDSLEPVGADDLMHRMRNKQVTVLDVRPHEEYVAGHIRGAINIPYNNLAREASALPKDNDIVAYCRGPFCIFSFEAVASLRSKGYKIFRLEYGFPEWSRAGNPVETGIH